MIDVGLVLSWKLNYFEHGILFGARGWTDNIGRFHSRNQYCYTLTLKPWDTLGVELFKMLVSVIAEL